MISTATLRFRDMRVPGIGPLVLLVVLIGQVSSVVAETRDDRNPLFAYLTGAEPARMICYTPAELDPRFEANQGKLATSSIRADLVALRPAFDGLVLYGYHEACTPRVLAVAKDLKYRAVLLAIWNPKSAAEIDGVAALARQYVDAMAIGVLVGNEGITFRRYEEEDLAIAESRLRKQVPKSVPLSTSEPLVGYQKEVVLNFGEFLCPNIHPVFDRKDLAVAPAAGWAREEAAKLAEKTGKPVVLKETGFPHAGAAQFTPESQREFWSAYLQPARVIQSGKGWAFHGVAFEAFDLPWKSAESKLEIEKSWGLFSTDRKPYPAFEAWLPAKQ
jgi:exo-beta-1,3-glucanase (GH17 family)